MPGPALSHVELQRRVQAQNHVHVVLVSPRNPLNIGAAARAMSNFGFSSLRLVNPYPVAFREACSAVGAASLLVGAKEYTSVAEAVEDCALVVGTTALRTRELQHPLQLLPQGARLIRQQAGRGEVAILFGSEKRGLSNDDLSHCHRLLRIPTREQHTSMNLGQAVAVCLYELVRDKNSATPPDTPKLAPAGELQRLTELLNEVLSASGYTITAAAASTEGKVRRLIHRLNPQAGDAEVLLGMLRQILWKLRAGKEPRA